MHQATIAETRAIRHQSLVRLRWLVLAGQAATIAVVQGFLHIDLPLVAMAPIFCASLLIILYLSLHPRAHWPERDLTAFLVFDSILLTGLLFLTGGLQNPFAPMLLLYVTIATAILSRRGLWWVGGVTFFCLTLLAFMHQPLPWRDGQGLLLDRLYSCGVWTALMLAAVFITTMVRQLGRDRNDLAHTLQSAQAALARQQRIAAVGGLMADAAHQLATPLTTVTLLAQDLAEDKNLPEKTRGEIAQILSQARHCKNILQQLSQQARGLAEPAPPSPSLPAQRWWQQLQQEWQGLRPEIIWRVDLSSAMAATIVPNRPEINQAVGQVLQNALRHGKSAIDITFRQAGGILTLVVQDDGPGFSAQELWAIQKSARPANMQPAGGMGLGLFIAQTLLEQLGGSLVYSNGDAGGARVELSWKLEPLAAQRAVA